MSSSETLHGKSHAKNGDANFFRICITKSLKHTQVEAPFRLPALWIAVT